VSFGVDPDLSEELRIAKWAVQLASQYWREVDLLLRAVLELHSQGARTETLECTTRCNACVNIGAIVTERSAAQAGLPATEPSRPGALPCGARPRLDQSPLRARHLSGDQVAGIHSEDRHVVLIERVKVWSMVLARPASVNIRITMPKNLLISGTVKASSTSSALTVQ
jgi:hypothetical protein